MMESLARRHVLLLAIPLLLCAFRATSPLSQPSLAVVDSPHPMLFFRPVDVPSLQRKAWTSHRAIAERLVEAAEAMKNDPKAHVPPLEHAKFTSSWNEEYGNNLCALAMYCVLFPEDEAALKLAHQFMDIMAGHASWEFAKMATDEMPISHSLVGMATAYDFLYPTLSVEQRRRYFARIRKTTARHFERFKTTSWGRWHLQNHVWNNNVALFIGAMVTSTHDPRANLWLKLTIKHLNISMSLMGLIVDGSNSEGVSYSTLSARSIMMFANLMERHYKVNYYRNFWLQKYFGFLYGTLIGYTESVGIADANPTWFFGPESMLVFLDRFVLRNGQGNWLAARTRSHRARDPPWANILTPSVSQRWATYHTEFLWYDETLGETDPNPAHRPRLAVFSDWGVVTYGGGLPPNHTFFSFKCGLMHGRAINNAVKERQVFPHHIEGWKSFNPGHEHPDQGSFTFWPRGKPFITEAYYGPKFSFLNNALMFAPGNSSSEAKCFPPYVGQIGECHKWLEFTFPTQLSPYADIVAAYEVDGYVFTGGEMAGAYSGNLLLDSVYRAAILLPGDVLVVMDHVALGEESTLNRASAFFNMRQGTLRLTNNASYPEAVLRHSGEEFYATWVPSAGLESSTAEVTGIEFPCEFKTRETQFLNVTFLLEQDGFTRVAYIFHHGSFPRPVTASFTEESDLGYRLAISAGKVKYNISIVTNYGSVVDRLNWLGHTGFATLSTSTGDFVRFGYTCSKKEHSCSSSSSSVDSYLPTVFLSAIEGSGVELLVGALNVSQDFAVVDIPLLQTIFEDTTGPAGVDPCRWERGDTLRYPPWMSTLFSTSYLSLGELHGAFRPLFPTKQHSRLVVYSDTGEMSWELDRFPMTDSMKMIHVLRDPRAWVAMALETNKGVKIWTRFMQRMSRLDCVTEKLILPFQKLQEFVTRARHGDWVNFNLVEVLALYWSGHALGPLQSQLGEQHLRVVWLEELVAEPEETLEEVVEDFLGLPLPPASRHHLLQYTRSGELRLASGELLRHTDKEWWRRVLSAEEIRTVEWTVSQYIKLSDYV